AIQTGERIQPESIYQCVNMLKTVIGINKEETGYNGHYPTATSRFRKSFEDTYCIGIDRSSDGQIHYAEAFFNPYEVSSITLNWEIVDETTLLERLKKCSTQNLHLINELKKEAERVRKELAIREKEAAVRAEQQRLKEKALQKAAFINELIRYIDPCKQAEDEIESLNEQQKATTKSDSRIAIARAPDTEASYV